MKRFVLAVLFLGGCYEPESDLDVHIDIAPQHQEMIDGRLVFPYRSGGTFVVQVGVTGEGFETGTRATLAIDSGDLVMGATPTTTVTLVPEGPYLVGTGALAWPRGGPIKISAEALGVGDTIDVEIERPELAHPTTVTTNNGTQTTMDVCFDSTTADGTAAVRVEGAMIKDSNEAMVPLTIGTCTGSPMLAGASSHGRVKLTVTGPSVVMSATLPNTDFALVEPLPVPMFGPITLELDHSAVSPAGLVTLDITATRPTGGNGGIVVSLLSSPPSLPFLPATVTTNDMGRASVQFQMPQSGGVVIQARVGDVTQTEVVP